MIAHRYEDLVCWQLANELKRKVYAFTAIAPAKNDFKYCAQVRDSARSGTSNISEGFGRFRPSEFARFLEFSRASLIETQNHLGDARDLGYISHHAHGELNLLANRAIGATTNLLKYLRNCKQPRSAREPRTKNSRTKNSRTQNQNQEPSTKNSEPGKDPS